MKIHNKNRWRWGCLLFVAYLNCERFDVVRAKYIEGHLQTSDSWVFLARFCFLSYEGQFEYQIEFNQEVGIPNLLLYYDDESQWPNVYHSNKTCHEREAVLNKKGQNQIIPLSPLNPINDFSGCVIRAVEPDYSKNGSVAKQGTKTQISKNRRNKDPNNQPILNITEKPSYYDQFLISFPSNIQNISTTSTSEFSSTMESSTEGYNKMDDNVEILEDFSELKIVQNNGNVNDSDILSNLQDVETFSSSSELKSEQKVPVIIKRFAPQYESSTMKKFNVDPPRPTYLDPISFKNKKTKMVVVCHNSRRFRSVRERWWFIAISNCNKTQNLDIKYRFLMTNGPPGDYWHEHFSADEFYVLPILMAFCFAYVIMIMAMVMCTIELKTRQMLHTTYKMFVLSVCLQQGGILLQSLAYVKYAVNGVGTNTTKIFGQSLSGASEATYLLLLILMAKGYTITRARLKTTFTVKLTVFMCCYSVTYTTLFIYQAEEFDPGEVLYLYESPAGYGLIVLRICAWFMFAYAIIFTIKKYPEKTVFYYPFSLCGTMWFYAGPLFILTANNYIDKWVRESVVIAVLLLISFCGHIFFLLLTLPVFANKNFPYHVRTTQIGVMEVVGMMSGTVDNFGHSVYMPNSTNFPITQSVIIPLTRRTEELIGSSNHFIASAPPLHALSPFHQTDPLRKKEATISHISGNGVDLLTINNVGPKLSISTQHSAESASSDKIINQSYENQLDSLENRFIPQKSNELKEQIGDEISMQNGACVNNESTSIFTVDRDLYQDDSYKMDPNYVKDINNPFLVGANIKARKSLLEPIKRESHAPPPPLWSLAKVKPKDKTKKQNSNLNGKSLHEEHQLQGVIGSFPLPQIPKKDNVIKLENDDASNETDSIIIDRDSLNSLQIMQNGKQKIDDTTMALFTVPRS